jgi:hypothetical protein
LGLFFVAELLLLLKYAVTLGSFLLHLSGTCNIIRVEVDKITVTRNNFTRHLLCSQYNRNMFRLSNSHPQAIFSQYQISSIFTNTLIKTTVRNKYLFVLDFIVHY